MATNTKTLKTNECLNYMQKSMSSQTPIHLKCFRVSSSASELSPERSLADIGETWYEGTFSEEPVSDDSQHLRVFVDIPSNIKVTKTEYVKEVYVIGTFDGEDFLFSITQVVNNNLPYLEDASYFFTLIYQLNSTISNPELIIVDLEKNTNIVLTTNWTYNVNNYYQDVPVIGLDASSRPIVGLIQADSELVASDERSNFANVVRAVAMNNAIRFYSLGITSRNLNLQVKITNQRT